MNTSRSTVNAMKESILIIEDEQELCLTLGDRLRNEGYYVDVAIDGKAGWEKATQLPFDLIILDIMLPYRSGLDLCTDIRGAGMATPILLLTARSQTIEKVIGLKSGADDYMTKPFDTMELLARVEALLRRMAMKTEAPATSNQETYSFGSIVVDIRKTTVTRDGVRVSLTAQEFQLLRYFVENSGVTLSRDKLLREVWGHRVGTFTRTVDVHVASLRQKLEASSKNPAMIITVPGLGYRFQM